MSSTFELLSSLASTDPLTLLQQQHLNSNDSSRLGTQRSYASPAAPAAREFVSGNTMYAAPSGDLTAALQAAVSSLTNGEEMEPLDADQPGYTTNLADDLFAVALGAAPPQRSANSIQAWRWPEEPRSGDPWQNWADPLRSAREADSRPFSFDRAAAQAATQPAAPNAARGNLGTDFMFPSPSFGLTGEGLLGIGAQDSSQATSSSVPNHLRFVFAPGSRNTEANPRITPRDHAALSLDNTALALNSAALPLDNAPLPLDNTALSLDNAVWAMDNTAATTNGQLSLENTAMSTNRPLTLENNRPLTLQEPSIPNTFGNLPGNTLTTGGNTSANSTSNQVRFVFTAGAQSLANNPPTNENTSLTNSNPPSAEWNESRLLRPMSPLNFLGPHPDNADDLDSIGTVDPPSDTEDTNPLPVPPQNRAPPIPDTPATLEPTCTTRRTRRQAAIRGLERISTALATHGMGGNSDDDDTYGRSQAVNRTSRLPRTSTRTPTADECKPQSSPRKRPAPSDTADEEPPRKCAVKEEDGIKKEALPDKLCNSKVEESPSCCICLEEPTYEELASINGCSHPFCFTCIEKWADRENTCPLCKARFFKIEKVNKLKRKNGEPDGERSCKRVRNRDQRNDLNFTNPLQGIFASMEANGTWPTHIAQLLFSGLGAASIRRNDYRPFPNLARSRSTMRNFSSSASVPSAPRRQTSEMTPPPVRFSTRYRSNNSSNSSSNFLNRVSVSRHHLYEIGEGLNSSMGTFSTAPPAGSPQIHSSVETSPWSASASIHVTVGPNGFNRTSSASPPDEAPGLGSNQAGETLFSLSPTSYLQRLHRNQNNDSNAQYQFNTAQPSDSSVGATNSSHRWSDPSSSSNQSNGRAGRSPETALEIVDSDDDDVVEVVAVGATV